MRELEKRVPKKGDIWYVEGDRLMMETTYFVISHYWLNEKIEKFIDKPTKEIYFSNGIIFREVEVPR
jgi:hypothetical protein